MISSNDSFAKANQLIRIAQMELGSALTTGQTLIIGNHELCGALSELIDCKTARSKEELEFITARNDAEKFNAVFLFDQMGDETLKKIVSEQAIIIDMFNYQNGETVYYDLSLPYRRIRIVSLFEDAKI